ncbi:hypothetical protein H6F43_00500 [Leptolyngbya sp. FACHB-36]|uniref:hypothetical protein n=1 Tax=Leptolyngbya sp. FACHB-36 TaxID=2692808 RepID=UPI00168140DB|nr:hypothetical protein [Leptolyngbya sp. FACHB-36]MBD2018663.1 hypothetical protein [Leptolyngbya sp. FACHB-36]
MSQSFVIGVKTKLFFTVMPEELLVADLIVPPTDVNITVSEVIEADEDELTVSAPLTGPIPAGTPIPLTVGTGAAARTLKVYTAAHARIGDTKLEIVPVTINQIQRAMKSASATDFATGSTGTYKAKLRLQGGTTSSKQIQNQNTETKIYQDGLAYNTGLITGAGWTVPYTSNLLPLDDGYYRLNYAGVRAIEGIHGYLWLEEPPAVGYTRGNGIAGLVQLENFNTELPSDGIVSFQTQFLGRGEPALTPYS